MAPSSSAQQQSQGGEKTGVKNKVPLKKKAVKNAAPKDSSKKRKAKNLNSYSRFIFKTLRELFPEVGISSTAMDIMDSFVTDMFEQIVNEAALLVKARKLKTLTARDIQFATRLVLPGELGRTAVSTGVTAVAKYFQSKQ